jgi:hypothetical protein
MLRENLILLHNIAYVITLDSADAYFLNYRWFDSCYLLTFVAF